MEKRIFTKEDYKKMSRMLQGTDEDVNLVIQMVDKCNIKESFLYILALIPHKYKEIYTFCTPLSCSKNLYAELYKYPDFDSYYDLDILVKIWSTYCKNLNLGLSIYTQGQKFLAMEYVPTPRNTFRRNNKFSIKK